MSYEECTLPNPPWQPCGDGRMLQCACGERYVWNHHPNDAEGAAMERGWRLTPVVMCSLCLKEAKEQP